MTISLHESDKHRRIPPRLIRRIFIILSMVLMVVYLAGPLETTLWRSAALRDLTKVAAHVPDSEVAKAIPCARAPGVDKNDRTALIDALRKLKDPLHRATAFCLLGNTAGALAEYQQAARSGDSWSAMQAYYLLAKSGDMGAAGRILEESHLSERDLLFFFQQRRPARSQDRFAAAGAQGYRGRPGRSCCVGSMAYSGFTLHKS